MRSLNTKANGPVQNWSVRPPPPKTPAPPLGLVVGGVSFLLGVTCVAEVGEGRFVSGSNDKSLRLWSAGKGEAERVFEGHSYAVTCVSPKFHHHVLYAGGGDTQLYGWQTYSHEASTLHE